MTIGDIPNKTFITNKIIPRMNDAEYIEYLEKEIKEIHRLTNLLINKMDEIQTVSPNTLSREYTNYVHLIQFRGL